MGVLNVRLDFTVKGSNRRHTKILGGISPNAAPKWIRMFGLFARTVACRPMRRVHVFVYRVLEVNAVQFFLYHYDCDDSTGGTFPTERICMLGLALLLNSKRVAAQ